MLKRFVSLSALTLAASLALPAQAQDGSTVVATVNGVEITLGHMIVARATLPEQYQNLPDTVLFDGILDQLIQQQALANAYDGDLPNRVALSLENETRSLTAGEVVEEILVSSVTEEKLRAAYDVRFANMDPGNEFNASHILVETEEEAKAIVEELAAGADFAEMAKDKSTGPSGPGGGSLGWFGPGMMVPPFEAAVAALEVGAVSAPVQTQFGWHVIKLNETRQANIPSFDDVRAELEEQVRSETLSTRIEEMVANSEVDRSGAEGIDPAILKDISKLN